MNGVGGREGLDVYDIRTGKDLLVGIGEALYFALC
jgi:hypothetical protein